MSRSGISPHQHAILLHELAEHIRFTVDVTDRSKSELVELVDALRAWIGATGLRLLDDSLALHTLQRQRATDDGGEGGVMAKEQLEAIGHWTPYMIASVVTRWLRRDAVTMSPMTISNPTRKAQPSFILTIDGEPFVVSVQRYAALGDQAAARGGEDG